MKMASEDDGKAIDYIIKRIIAGGMGSKADIYDIKKDAAGRFGLAHLPKTSGIVARFPKSKLTKRIAALLKRKPVRTISGVTPIAVMIMPAGSCRYGCIYCPLSDKAPKSYTGEEPAALRARACGFDAAGQVRERLRQFALGGHETDKCEVILMGGTFLEMSGKYKNGFVKGIYDALNGKPAANLTVSKKINETARHRVVGLTIETRPDVCGRKEINEMLDYGATKVELGVQNPDDSIYRKVSRGHGVREVVEATELLKDSAFKVLYHIMPGLPGSSAKKDVAMVRRLFSDERFRPDMLKIYPTLVIPGTVLHGMFLRGKYEPYGTEEAADVISEFYRYIPKYVRVMRIQRDIPSGLIAGGVRKSNLRELVERKVSEKNIKINEIRFREAGFAGLKDKDGFRGFAGFGLARFDYPASKGKEIFLSYEKSGAGDDNANFVLAGFIRLRIPNSPFRSELQDSALVREFHVYGEEAGIGAGIGGTGRRGKVQHRGIGSALLREAERIAREEFGFGRVSVISGVGARQYFYKKGYWLNGAYVSKKIR